MDDHVAKPFAVAMVVQVILRHVGGGTEPAPIPSAPPPTTLPVLDRAGALGRLGQDADLLDAVLKVFRGNLATAMQQLAQAGDMPREELLRLFHSVKGMAANVGALALSAAAAEAEQALRHDVFAPVAPHASGVAQAIADVLRALGPAG
jgi:HPt (histidine-containing phosphotransfer) domain-containing protein